MHLPTFLTTSALALTVSAFLVPLEVADAAIAPKLNDDFNAATIQPSSESIEVELDCSTCPFALSSTRHGQHEWVAGVKSNLLLNFTVENKRLSLNGVPFHPLAPGELPQPMFAQQVKQESEAANEVQWVGAEEPLRLSFSLEFPPEQSFEESELKGQSIFFKIIAIDNEIVDVDSILIKTLKKADGGLMIGSISTEVSPISPAGKKCHTVICRFLADFMAKLDAARGKVAHAGSKVTSCMGFRPKGFAHRPPPPPGSEPPHGPHGHHGPPPPPPPHEPGDHPPHGPPGKHGKYGHGGHGPHGHRPHHPHHHSVLHKIMHGIKRVFRHVVLPMLVGIAAGMAACAVGMLIGQVGVFLYMRFRGRNAVQYERVEVDDSVEKEGLPRYEDVEAGEVTVVDEKENS